MSYNMSYNMAHMSNFLVWFLNFGPFNLKMVPFSEFILSAKTLHKHINQHGSPLISISASETLQYAFSATDMAFRVLAYVLTTDIVP